MKFFLRLAMLYIIIGYLIAGIIAPYSSENADIYQLKDWLIIIWGVLFVIIVFSTWVLLFMHFKKVKFDNLSLEKMWFWILLLGGFLYFVGPMIYYVIVYEMHKGLLRKT